jgi:GntR family transcriptional regulator, transcriptional repressor for pyruvate dehydrogenase complex
MDDLSPQLSRSPGKSRKRSTLADQVASLIEERIIQGTLVPGEKLPIEYDLASELNVSRTVIRDAVRTLAARRLVDVRQGLGTVVTNPDPEAYAHAALMFLVRSDCTVHALWEARKTLDFEMTAAAIRSGSADWSRAEAELAALETAVATRDWDGALRAHARFHLALMTAMGNPVIEILLQPMLHVIIATPSAPKSPVRKEGWNFDLPRHPPLLEAAKAGDVEALRVAVEKHYVPAKRIDRRASNSLLRDSPAALEVLRQAQTGG